MVFFAARAKNGWAVTRQMQNILRPFPKARAAYTGTQNAPREHQANTKEFLYQDTSTNTREKNTLLWANEQGQIYKNWRFILWAVQAFISMTLGKLLYLVSPFLPKNWKRNALLFTESLNVGKALGTTRVGALQTTRTKSATDTISL